MTLGRLFDPTSIAVVGASTTPGKLGAVMFDAHSSVPPATLIQLAAAIKPYDVLFIEEPAVPGNIEVFKRIKEQVAIPLAAALLIAVHFWRVRKDGGISGAL